MQLHMLVTTKVGTLENHKNEYQGEHLLIALAHSEETLIQSNLIQIPTFLSSVILFETQAQQQTIANAWCIVNQFSLITPHALL